MQNQQQGLYNLQVPHLTPVFMYPEIRLLTWCEVQVICVCLPLSTQQWVASGNISFFDPGGNPSADSARCM